MSKKKFSQVRMNWTRYMSKDTFVHTFAPQVLDLPPNTPGAGGRNAVLFDMFLLSESPFVEHVFLETKELFNFLADSPIRDQGFSHLLAKEWADRPDIHPDLRYSRMLVIHHQQTSFPSIKVIYNLLDPGRDSESFYLYIEDGDQYLGLVERQQGRYSIASLNEDYADLPSHRRFARLALNFLLYERCFPQCLVDGTPEEIANPNYYKRYRRARTLTIADELVHHRDGMVPHFRSGYFKTLDSDYFTKKRGQTIFVRSTFVKGKAKTMLDTNEKEMMDGGKEDRS